MWQLWNMGTSTLTDKGQTKAPPKPSALDLFGSLKPSKKFPGRAAEREAAMRALVRGTK